MDRSSVPDHSNRLPSAERLLSIWENPAAKYEQSQSKGSKGGKGRKFGCSREMLEAFIKGLLGFNKSTFRSPSKSKINALKGRTRLF